MATSERPQLPCIALGASRLPRSISGDGGAALMLEVTYDPRDRRIVDIATTVPLPGYLASLQRALIGCRIDDALAYARSFSDTYHGPLGKATLAAIANAVANSRNGVSE